MVLPNPTQSKVRGCDLIGSISNCPDAQTAFTESARLMPNRLKRFPDGETGERQLFVFWQFLMFMQAGIPQIIRPFEMNKAAASKNFSTSEIEEGNSQLSQLHLNTRYDEAAIERYAVFKKLKNQGIIPAQAKFQSHAQDSDEIPHEELSIQIDLSIDTALWEGLWETSWHDDPKESQIRYILRMISQVDRDVELGLHNCYGDMEHKHFFEPISLQALTDRALALLSLTPHKIAYFHCPVPQSAMSRLTKYLSPLSVLYPALQQHGCELYLGLAIHGDLEGPQKRIEEVRKFASEFGVSTACGWGRNPPEEIEETMRLLTEVSEPIL